MQKKVTYQNGMYVWPRLQNGDVA